MLQRAMHVQPFGGRTSDSNGWRSFFEQGDSFVNGLISCAGGPPVLTQAVNGWAPNVRRVAWAHGSIGDTQRNYGRRNDDREFNGDNKFAHPGLNAARVWRHGDEYMTVDTQVGGCDGCVADYRLHLWRDGKLNDDLEPGSRHDLMMSGSERSRPLGILWASGSFSTNGNPTFMPTRSALDLPYLGATPTLDDYWYNDFNAMHRAIANWPGTGKFGRVGLLDWLLGDGKSVTGQFEKAMGFVSSNTTLP
jgi:hypothetical protein